MLLICDNAIMRVYGAWVSIYYDLCPKTDATFGGLFWPPLVLDKPLGAPYLWDSLIEVYLYIQSNRKKYELPKRDQHNNKADTL